MAESTYVGLGDLFVPATLNRELHTLLGAQEPDLRQMARYHGSVSGTGSLTSKIAKIDASTSMAAANADETTAPGDTILAPSSVTCTVARQVLVRVLTDPYIVAGGVRPGIEWAAQQMKIAALQRFNSMLTALYTAVASGVGGGAGVDFVVDDFYDAQYTLRNHRVPGRYFMNVSPHSYNEFISDLRGETGAIQYLAEVARALGLENDAVGGIGYAGRLLGVDIVHSSAVADGGGASIGCMWGEGAFGYMDGIPSEIVRYAGPGSSLSAMPNGGTMYVGIERREDEGDTRIVGNYYVGVTEVEDLRAVKITTDDT